MRIKLLLVASEYAPGMIPFASTIINTLSSDDRFEIRCICVCSNKYSYKNSISKNIQSTFINYPQSNVLKLIYKFWPLKLIKAINEIEDSFQPAITHFLTGDFSLRYFIKLHKKSNYCYTVHDLHKHEVDNRSVKDKFLQNLIDNGYKVGHKYCNNLTTSSKAQIAELLQLYPNKNIVYTPFPTLINEDIIAGRLECKELNGLSGYILFFGSLHDYKGIGLLIDAYNMINNPKPKLVIAGNGVVNKKTSSSIILINRYIDDKEIRSLFENAKLVVYPYLSATMSGVLSIALYFRKHILLSDIPFFLENKTEGCEYFKAGNSDDLKEKLLEFFNSPHAEYPDQYKSIYSSEVLCDSYYNFYKKII